MRLNLQVKNHRRIIQKKHKDPSESSDINQNKRKLKPYVLNWAHRYVDKHTTHKIDHTIYSAIEDWNSEKMACNYECFH